MGKLITPLRKIRRLEILYVATIGVMMIMVVCTPFLVRRWISETDRLLGEQEVMEALLIAVLLSLAYALSHIYKALIRSHREEIQHLAMNNTTLQCRLTEAFKYIGNVNLEAIAGEIELFFIAFAAMHSHGVDPTIAHFPRPILGLRKDYGCTS
jgi:hypothetical protein